MILFAVSLNGCGGPLTGCQTILGESHEVYEDKCPPNEILVGRHRSDNIIYCSTITVNCPTGEK